jgi:hypothetical protein
MDFTQTIIGKYLCPGSCAESRFSRKKARGEVTENGLQCKTSRVKATRKKGLYAKRTDTNGNRTLEPVRKQLEEDRRKTEQQENGSRIGTGYK